ncbi:type IV pilus modification PilV family protein [Marinicellulosiphila megalodicopiae]|uniref:type IV pilus modification PilV family protein n=1 Tax=Marinicellulosiphila megalodicopiae TaxID=2724896 RepID=UPI003BAE6508
MQISSFKHSNLPNVYYQSGFTLIEVMMALLIFAFAATSLTAGFQSSTNNSIRAEQNLQANYVAQYQIERLTLSGSTQVEPSFSISMFDKKWTITQTVEPLNKLQEAQAEQEIGLREIEDFEVFSESFNSAGDSNGFEEPLKIPDSYLVLTVEVTPEDELGHATMQTLLIKGLLQ